jgi:hypothetical protein
MSLPNIKGAEAVNYVNNKIQRFFGGDDWNSPTVDHPNERKVKVAGKEYHAKTYYGKGTENGKEVNQKLTEINGKRYFHSVELDGKRSKVSSLFMQTWDDKTKKYGAVTKAD